MKHTRTEGCMSASMKRIKKGWALTESAFAHNEDKSQEKFNGTHAQMGP